MTLLPDWKDILKKAWSIRLILLAAVLSGFEIVLPLLMHAIPHGVFAVMSFFTTCAALIARLVAQKT